MWQLAELRNGLLTREALDRALTLLGEDGVLVIYQDRRWLIERVAASLDSLEVPWMAVASKHFQPPGRARKKLLFASRDPSRLVAVEQTFLDRGFRVQQLELAPAEPLTDDRPVGAPSREEETLVRRALGLALTVLGCLAGGLALVGGGPRGWRTTVAFVAIGHGFLGMQLYAVARFRDLFHSPIQTLATVSACFLGGTVLGHLASHRLSSGTTQGWRWPGLAAVGLACVWLYLGTALLPFHEPSTALRTAATVLTLVPPGVLCGLYFPVALGRTPPGELGLALLADGLGTCLAFVAFFAATWTWGASTALLPVALGYVVATWLLTDAG